jgi:predicted transcriptional regulator
MTALHGLTLVLSLPYSKAMEVHFNPELQAKLDRVAAENSSEADQYVQQLVEHYLDHDVWFRQKVKTSLERLDRGEFLTHEEMGARIDKKFGS